MEARTTWLTTRVLPGQPAGKQTFQFYIYTVKGYCYTLNRPTKILFSQRFFLSIQFSFTPLIVWSWGESMQFQSDMVRIAVVAWSGEGKRWDHTPTGRTKP